MNFLLIPKNGNPRFHTGNPFYYIEKRGMIPVKDYFDFFDENMLIIGDALTVNHVFTDEEDYEYYFIIFNKDGADKRLDMIGSSDMNVIASNFYNAYNRQYVGNYTKIYSDAILVKTTAGRKIEDMSVEDKNNIREMLKDAEWVEQYLDGGFVGLDFFKPIHGGRRGVTEEKAEIIKNDILNGRGISVK